MVASTFRIGETDTWVTSVPLDNTSGDEQSPLALHFVIDNSGSMGRMTQEVKTVFSSMVDSAASKPCSLTLFGDRATLLSDNITTSKEMIELHNPYQGSTNIPAGVRTAMETIVLQEVNENTLGAKKKTHHILILLTDGGHNCGPTPEREFPKIGKELMAVIPEVQLSVVVVGITRSSSTSMGMNLKTSLETVPLDSSYVENIYFAMSRNEMNAVTSKLVDGLNTVSKGTVHTVSRPDGLIVSDLNGSPQASVSIRSTPSDTRLVILFQSKEAPSRVDLNSKTIAIEETKADYGLIAETLAKHIDKTRVQRVASKATSAVRASVAQLNILIDALDEEMKKKDGAKLKLEKVRGAQRLAQNRYITKTMHLARELRNQLAEVANFAANSSAEQAAFLTGKSSKFASKALRRAANRMGDGFLNPKKEMEKVYGELTSQEFHSKLKSHLRRDTFSHVARLSKSQIQHLENHVKKSSRADFLLLQQFLNSDAFASFSRIENTGPKTPATQSKVHTTALCWIPPEDGELHNAIQSIRQKHDRQIDRWPPHVNLLYPFVPVSEFENAAKKLANTLSTLSAFDVTMQAIDHFAHNKKSYTAWLRPEQSQEFATLQAMCQTVFPHCDDLIARGAFVPHLTVGQCAELRAVDELISEADWNASSTSCGEICLISRKGKNDPFEVHWRVQLGESIPMPGPAVDAEPEDKKSTGETSLSPKTKDIVATLSSKVKEFVHSGALANYLNEAFFDGRQSYLSLTNPWEHIAEWLDLEPGKDFESQWEMLLYAGSLAYPITVERSAGTQMNPFQLKVNKIHTTAIDTASLCCANHSGIDTYGPEGGEPIKDALVLVDPSCPHASTMIASSYLLGETFTSVVVSRDLHMYTGASMKIALLGQSLFCCLQPEPTAKDKSGIVADIRREFLGKAYQCSDCGFGPVDHGGCSDLFSHHGEADEGGGVASNACPSCGWFSEELAAWTLWDGTVPKTMIDERNSGSSKKKSATKPLATKMDLVLRIAYSFRKLFFRSQNSIKEFYDALTQKLIDWDLSLTTQDDIDGLVQVLLAVMTSDNISDEKAVAAAFAPPIILAIVNEACARAARKKFRMAAQGDEAELKKLAVKHVTSMLHVSPETAPETTESLFEPEPTREKVEQSCAREYSISADSDNDREWVQRIANRWCKALSLAKALRTSIIHRGGGWQKLEQDMETSLGNYEDVVQDLQNAELEDIVKMCDLEEKTLKRTLTTMATQAYLYNKGSSRQELPDVTCGETLSDIARDMRMQIYFERVREKMAQWTSQGEQLAFLKARASDIGQYTEMVDAHKHVHGMSKEMFWGLWEAAMCDGYSGDKVWAFLRTANDAFRFAHAQTMGSFFQRFAGKDIESDKMMFKLSSLTRTKTIALSKYCRSKHAEQMRCCAEFAGPAIEQHKLARALSRYL